jgi:hypothetical protein
MAESEAKNILPFEARIASLERYAISHGETLGKHTGELIDLKTERAVRIERDKNLDERLERIEEAINKLDASNTAKFSGIYKLGWWVLGTFGASFIALLANFLFKGGFAI